jgi:hypothetical protein
LNKKRVTWEPSHWRNPATKPFSRHDEIILKPTNLYRGEASLVCGLGVRIGSMFEAAILLGLFSAGIFVAHAVEAYHAQ